jgi:hypothetical protein
LKGKMPMRRTLAQQAKLSIAACTRPVFDEDAAVSSASEHLRLDADRGAS